MLATIFISTFIIQMVVFTALRAQCANALVAEQGDGFWLAMAFTWMKAKTGHAKRYRDQAIGWLLLSFTIDMVAAIIVPNVIAAMR